MLKLRSVLLVFGAVSASSALAEPKFQVVDLHVDLPYQLGFHGKPLREGTGQAALGQLRAKDRFGRFLPAGAGRAVRGYWARLAGMW
jgi:hypothetical protein